MSRRITKILTGRPTMEGAGVRLKRVFGFHEVPLLDPFLLLDHFGSSNPEDYIAGFPWHPHRGIETVTYMISGSVEHGDSLNNNGVIGSGDVQWMTAGSGIVHQEMPLKSDGMLEGFQLWVNLPAASKMMKPRYREIKSRQIPSVRAAENIDIKIISGELNGMRGPVRDLIVDVEYLDVTMRAHADFIHAVHKGTMTFAYVYRGKGFVNGEDSGQIIEGQGAILHEGDSVRITTREEPMSFILFSGQPLKQPVAWYGPIVMNTTDELELAFKEYREGTFIKNQ